MARKLDQILVVGAESTGREGPSRLFFPVLRMAQSLGTPNRPLVPLNRPGRQFMYHPGVGILGKNWVGSLEASCSSWDESEPRVVVRVAKDKYQFDSTPLKLRDSILDQSTPDALTLPIASDG